MADRNITLKQPTAGSIKSITTYYDLAGKLTNIQISYSLKSDDGGFEIEKAEMFKPEDFDRASVSGLESLASESAGLAATKEGF